jgi:hypothetical protein
VGIFSRNYFLLLQKMAIDAVSQPAESGAYYLKAVRSRISNLLKMTNDLLLIAYTA